MESGIPSWENVVNGCQKKAVYNHEIQCHQCLKELYIRYIHTHIQYTYTHIHIQYIHIHIKIYNIHIT